MKSTREVQAVSPRGKRMLPALPDRVAPLVFRLFVPTALAVGVALAGLAGQREAPPTETARASVVSFVAGSSGGGQLAASLDTGTFSLNGGRGKTLVAIVSWITSSDNTVTSVVWDPAGANQALSGIGSTASLGKRRIQAFRLANPSAGVTAVVRARWSDASNGSQAIVAGAYSCPSRPPRVADWTTAKGRSDVIRLTVRNVGPGDIVMDSWMHEFDDATIGTGQSLIGKIVTPGNAHGGSYQSGAYGGEMSWSGFPMIGDYLTGALRITTESSKRHASARN